MVARVLYIVPPTRSYAGIERVIDEICNALAVRFADVLDIDVLYMSEFENHVVSGESYNKIMAVATGRRHMISIVRKVMAEQPYDLVVVPQIEAAVVFWLARIGLERPMAVYLHGNPQNEDSHWKAKLLFGLMKTLVLPRLVAVFGTSPKQLTTFRERFGKSVDTYWLPNPVRNFEITQEAAEGDAPVRFVSVGRFSQQKGQDLLIQAFSRLYGRNPNVRLTLVGYGAEKPALEALIARLGLEGVVTLAHSPSDPSAALSRSDIYVSSSRWEGWSLAICEALRFGLPVVAFDCDFGPSDIILDEKLGLLVPSEDVEALSCAMADCAENLDENRKHRQYRQAYVDRFSVDNVVGVHAHALLTAIAAGGKNRACENAVEHA